MKSFKLNILYPLVALLLLSSCSNDDDVVNIPTFEKNINLGYNCQLTDIVETDDGGFLAVGIGRLKLLLIKFTATGDTLWTKNYSHDNNMETWGNSIIKTKDGNYVIAGFTNKHFYSTGYTYVIKINEQGSLIWSADLSYSSEGNYGNGNIAEAPDGSLFVITNRSEGSQNNYNLERLTADGNMLWSRELSGIYAGDIKATRDGNIVIVGSVYAPDRTTDVFLTKVNLNGFPIWTKTISDDKTNHAHSVTETPDGGFAITGHTGVAGMNRQIMLLLTTSNGELTALHHFGQSQADVGLMISLNKRGEFLIAGYQNTSGLRGELTAISVSGAGELLHSRNFGNLGRLLFIKETRDGGNIMGGQKDDYISFSKTGPNL